MIADIHCHILPGIDDGAKTLQETKKMLQMAKKEKIGKILATPHFNCERKVGFSKECQKAYEEICKELEERDLGIELFLGNEIFYSSGVLEALKKGEALTLNYTQYILIEFAPYVELLTIKKAVQELQMAGYFPILAHIERYECLKKEENVRNLVDMGAYIQVNASSLTGRLGMRTQWYLKKLMRHELVHVVATDAHGSKERRPRIQDAAGYIRKKAGIDFCRKVTEENPEKIIKGEKICG